MWHGTSYSPSVGFLCILQPPHAPPSKSYGPVHSWAVHNGLLCFKMVSHCILFCSCYTVPTFIHPSTLTTLMNLDTNMSRQFKLLCRDTYPWQRNRDCSSLPNQSMGLNTHISYLKDLRECLPTAAASFSSPAPPPPKKTRETAFQVLNRTVSTNNKAFKSQMRPDPDCARYHLLCECTGTHYSQLLWTCLD